MTKHFVPTNHFIIIIIMIIIIIIIIIILIIIYSTTTTVLKLTAHNDIKYVALLSATISSCKNACWHVIIKRQLVFSTGSRTSPLMLAPGCNKRPSSIKQWWSERSLLNYAGPSAPIRNKNVKRESYILITAKTNCKSGPTWPACFRL